MASIWRRGGVWVASYKLNGKAFTRSLRTSDEKMARKLKKELEVKIESGKHQQGNQCHLDTYWTDYIRDTEHRKARTNYGEQRIVRMFLDLVKKKTINAIDQEDVYRYLKHYPNWSPKTYNNTLICLKRFFRLAVQKGHILKNPTDGIHRKKQSHNLPKFFTDEEYMRIEKAAELLPAYPMIVTARYTGLRLRELLNLEWQDFDWERRKLHVRNKPEFGATLKNYQERVVPICEELREKLGPFRQTEGVCFKTYGRWRKEKRYLADGPKRQLKAIYAEAGIVRTIRTGWHAFRHTFASRLVQNGVSIARVCRWLGHSSVVVTEIYAKFEPEYNEDIEKLTIGSNVTA